MPDILTIHTTVGENVLPLLLTDHHPIPIQPVPRKHL